MRINSIKNKLKKIMKVSTIVILSLTTAILIMNQSCSSANYSTKDIKMKKIEQSAQYKDGVFNNYKDNYDINFIKSLPMIWDFLFTDNDRKPDVDLPAQKVDFNQIENAEPDELKVTWVGHSSQIITIDGKIILTDPVYENSTAFLGPGRYNGDVPINMNELPEVDLVIISHNHYDHLNSTTIETIHPKVRHFVVPLMVGAELEKMGVPREKITELDWWEEIILFDDFLIALTPAQHFSNRGMFDGRKTLWGSYVIQGPYHKIYFSGDSGYSESFKDIGNKYGPFDYTFLECGAYDERWHSMHMYPEETAQAHLDLKGEILQPMHWGTFNLALHSWYDPIVRVSKAADSLGIKLSTPIVGETITVNENLITERWWESFLNNKNLVSKD
jgi:L-ascorbate metabolism protein UlaG (beta-lactamase superfamily)